MSSSDSMAAECARYINLFYVAFYTLLLVAVVFIMVISMLTRRSRFKLHTCNGRPGPVVPLNLLDGFENRYAYAMAFVIAASDIITTVIENSFPWQGNTSGKKYLKIPVKILQVVFVATSAYPLFVCIGMRNRLVGSLIGLLFTVSWLSMKWLPIVGQCIHCPLIKKFATYVILYNIPGFIALIWLIIFFSRRTFCHMRDRSCFFNEDAKLQKDNHMYTYVTNLLKRNKRERMATPLKSVTERLIKNFKDSLYRPMPEFKFSTRIVCTFAVCFVALYMATSTIIFLWSVIARFQPRAQIIPYINITNNKFYRIFKGCYLFGAVFSSITSCRLLMNILQCHRENVMRLRVGDRHWLPPSMERYEISPTKLTFASMKYAGFQIGYVIIGYIQRMLYFFLVPAVIITLAHIKYFQKKALEYLPTFGMVLALYILQRLLAKFAFVQKKDGTAIINNRKAFNIFAYYMVFYNAILGSIHAIVRMCAGLVIGVLYFERMQKSILPKTFEGLDWGYRAYIGYLQIEHTFSNPVLCAFVHLLKEGEYYRARAATASSLEAGMDFRYHHMSNNFISDRPNQRLRNKWLVAYTLLKNPSLIQFRKRYRVVCLEEKEIDLPVIAKEETAIPFEQIPERSPMDLIDLSI